MFFLLPAANGTPVIIHYIAISINGVDGVPVGGGNGVDTVPIGVTFVRLYGRKGSGYHLKMVLFKSLEIVKDVNNCKRANNI